MKRRLFLQAAGAVALPCISPGVWSCTALATPNLEAEPAIRNSDQLLVRSAGCLDMTTAEQIVSGRSALLSGRTVGDFWLDLTGYSSYEQRALDHLVEGVCKLEGIDLGFTALTGDGARALTRLRADYLSLQELDQLDESVAAILCNWESETRPIKFIGVQQPLSRDAALTLVCGRSALPTDNYYTPLDLTLPSVSAAVAGAIRLQPHELYLRVRDSALSPEAALELSNHVGYSLWLFLDRDLPMESRLALESNPMKRVRHHMVAGSAVMIAVDAHDFLYDSHEA